MFGKKLPAEAVILADEGAGKMMMTDSHGVDWEHHTYVLEVHPAGEQPFRAEAKAKVPLFGAPEPGQSFHVLYEPKNHKTEIVIEGDPRYDPAIKRAQRKQAQAQEVANAKALLKGADPGALPHPAGTVLEDPELQDLMDLEALEAARPPEGALPKFCPACGAAVDPAAATAMGKHPKCPSCFATLGGGPA